MVVSRQDGRWIMTAVNSGRRGIVVAASDATTLVFNHSDKRCDGTADDVDIAEAITELGSAGGIVYLTDGNFTLAAGLSIPSNVSLIGAGPTATVLTWTDGAFHRVQNDDTSGGNSFIHISDLGMNFGGVSGSEDYHGIRLENVTDFYMERVELQMSPHHNLVSVTSAARWHIRDCISHDAGQRTATDGDGFRPRDGFSATTIQDGPHLSNCRSYDNSHHGIHVGPGGVVEGCYAWNNGDGSGGGNNLYVAGHEAQIIGGVYRDPNGSHNILVEGSENGSITGATVTGSSDTSSEVIRINGSDNAGFRVVNCIVKDSQRDNIRVNGGSDGVILANNVIDGVTAATTGVLVDDADRVVIVGNVIKDVTTSPGRGVELRQTSTTNNQCAVQNNTIIGCTTGVLIENVAGVTEAWVNGNVLDNTTDLNDAGGKNGAGAVNYAP